LKGDPKREAANAGRGFIYQYWQSVWRWLRLEPNEVLFIEKAEDFDVVSVNEAEAAEIKDTRASGNVTLNSQDALEAIRNFWLINQQNSEFTVHFRFLTTSDRGMEKGKPFGDLSGLDYWDCCKFDKMRLGRLRNFLLQKEQLPTLLKEFLRTATDDELQRQFVQRISWETGTRPIETLKAVITERVACLCDSKGFSPTLAPIIVARLFEHVCEVVASPGERRLHRGDLLTLLDRSIVSARSESAEIASQVEKGTPTTGKSGIPRSLAGQVRTNPPRLLTGASQRPTVVKHLLERLGVSRILVLTGSTGMGKSTLGKLVAASTGLPCRWIDLRGLTADEIQAVLYHETFRREGDLTGVVHVLDDMEINADFARFENNLVEFGYTVLSQGGSLIITTQASVPIDLLHRLGVNAGVEYQVTPLLQDELRELLANFGCGDEQKQKAWVALVKAHTFGHPQLALAMIKRLQAQHWPETREGLSSFPDSLAAVRKDARRLLRDSLPSEQARILAFRLSLLDTQFRRDHAIAIAAHEPAITLPGDAFDLLSGPWVEQVDETYFRISPLLQDAANEVWDAKNLTDLHRGIAYALLNCGDVTYLEASAVLRHALTSNAIAPLGPIAKFFAEMTEEEARNAARYFAWFAGEKLGPNDVLVPETPPLSSLFRRAQFVFAAHLSPTRLAPLVASAWEKELVPSGHEELDRLNRIGFLVTTVISVQVPFPVSVLVNRVVELLPLFEHPETKEFFQKGINFPDGEHLEVHQSMFSLVLARCNSIEQVMQLFGVLAKCDEFVRGQLLSLFEKHERWPSLLFGRIYLTEETKAEPNWELCVASLRLLAPVCTAWRQPALTAYCYASLAVMFDEYLKDSPSALQVIEDGQRVLGDRNAILANARAMILYRQDDYAAALAILRSILPAWRSNNAPLVFAYHKAVICAGQLGDWTAAAAFAKEGAQEAVSQSLKNIALGLEADSAWALWKSGQREESIEAFSEILLRLPENPDPEKDFREFALYKQIGHGIVWIWQDLKHSIELAEPPPGWFSVTDIDERIKEHSIRPLDNVWFILAQVEFELGSRQKVFAILDTRAKNSPLHSIRFCTENLRVRSCLRHGDLSTVVEKYTKSAETFRNAIRAFPSEFISEVSAADLERFSNPAASHCGPIEVIDVMFAATVLSRIQNRGVIPTERWRSSISEIIEWNSSPKIETWLRFVAGNPPESVEDLIKAVGAENNHLCGVGGLLLALNPSLSVEDLLIAHALLVNAAAHSVFRAEVEAEVERLVSRQWLDVASRSRFQLAAPTATAAAIAEASKAPKYGLSKAATVLLAAKDGVRVKLPNHLLKEVRLVADWDIKGVTEKG
jgi:tetratricopeptide (TPR) repeat protein